MASKRLQTLKRSSDFQKLKLSGRRVRPAKWLLLSYARIEGEDLQCGWTLSRKVASSVIRNRLKRWCREFFRAHTEELSGYRINVVFLPQPNDFFKKVLRRDLFAALEKARAQLR